MLPLALMGIVLIMFAVPAAAAPDGPDPVPAPDAPQTPEAEETTPDTPAPPSITCPRCGADCPAPHGHYGRRGHRGSGFDHRGSRHLHRAPAGFNRNRHMHGGGRKEALPAERFTIHADDLELTEEQLDLLEKSAYDTRQKLIDLEADLEKAQLEMRRLKEQGTENASDLKKQLRLVSDKKLAIQELRLENWIDSRNILTEDQKLKLDSYRSKKGPRI
jgi:Spy/CpxP family protein refolding chaperone